MGHAFEVEDLSNVPSILRDADGSPESKKLIEFLQTRPAFAWRLEEAPAPAAAPEASLALTADDSDKDAKPKSDDEEPAQGPDEKPEPDLFQSGVQALVTIPPGWGAGLNDGNPIALQAWLNGSDTTTAPTLEGLLQEAMGKFQLQQRDAMVDDLPIEVIEMGEKIPVPVRHRITSALEPWKVQTKIAYNPKLRFVPYVAPGIIGLVLQLLTIPLMAVTITRERESGTLSQLLLTSLRRWEIVVGKVIPHLLLSLVMVAVVMALAVWHFDVTFPRLPLLTGLCFLFLLCSLGLGLVFSAFCNTQAQAIQITVFFLLPTIPLSGAFAPLDQLPEGIKYLAEVFPLTHFCRAFRVVSLANAPFHFLAADAVTLGLGAVATFAIAALLLRRTE
jgi:ABC-2 type transport system permease protein